MGAQKGFDNDRYVEEQSAEILKRVDKYNNRLYLEFGGKLLFDYHAARVLPGYDPNVKIRLLQNLKEQVDLADFGITYESDALKLIDDIRDRGIDVLGVVITRFRDQPSAQVFRNKLERRDIAVYTHAFTKGYPTDIDLIVSDQGYGANSYIESEKPLVVITGPGPSDNRSGAGKRQTRHLSLPALSRSPERHPEVGLCQVRDLSDLEPASQTPGEHRL